MRDLRVRFRGQMRNGKGASWMTMKAEQHSFFDESERLFYMEASQYGVPFQSLHIYTGTAATMQVWIGSALRIVDARGPEMVQSETVTHFNDLCVMAPAALLDANVVWKTTGERTVSGTYTGRAATVTAELTFNAEGDLVDFVSRDRLQSADGKTFKSFPWSTPLTDYRDFGGVRVAARGTAIWREPDGDLEYGRFEIEAIEHNVGR